MRGDRQRVQHALLLPHPQETSPHPCLTFLQRTAVIPVMDGSTRKWAAQLDLPNSAIIRAMANKPPLIAIRIWAKLKVARIARLATLDARRNPHLVPICFACSGTVFYSAIDRKPKRVAPNRLARLKNIKKTPQVALLVDHYDEDWTRLWYVLVRGEAELVSAPAERKRALQCLRAKYRQYSPDMLDDGAPLLRITPQRITAWGNI
jgi:PPOX class probable F420-dependent enzyme